MDKKKSFKIDNPAMNFISKPKILKEQDVFKKQEVQFTQEDTKKNKKIPIGKTTQGNKKGEKLPRVNMAFSNENLDYLRIMSKITDTSMAGYIDRLLIEDRKSKKHIYKRAKEFIYSLI